MPEECIWSGKPSQIVNLSSWLLVAITGGVYAPVALWKYFVIKNIRFELSSQQITYTYGVFSKHFESLELYRVKDTKVDQPFLLRIFNLGNVTIISSDVSTPALVIEAIKNPDQLRQDIRNYVEQSRSRKRVFINEIE